MRKTWCCASTMRCGAGALSAVDELFAADFVGRHPGAPDWIGRRAVKDIVTAVRTGFPDFKEVVEDVVVAGEKVVTRFSASGTHLGPFMGLAPTGKPTSFAEVGIFRVVDGKIVEKWGLIDRLTRAQQLGAAPAGGVRSEYLYSVEMDVGVHDLGATPKGWRRIGDGLNRLAMRC